VIDTKEMTSDYALVTSEVTLRTEHAQIEIAIKTDEQSTKIIKWRFA